MCSADSGYMLAIVCRTCDIFCRNNPRLRPKGRMSNSIEIQWEILRAIPRHPKRITSGELTDSLERAGYEITKRSVERHLNGLSLKFPIVADDREKPFGWSWARDAESMTFPGMDLQTSLAFVAAEAFLRPLLPKSTLSYLAPHFRMARATLDREPGTFGRWKDKVRSLPRGFQLMAPAVDPAVEQAIYEALLKNRALDLLYQGRNDPEPKQLSLVHPLSLVYREPLIYLVCTMWDYREPRQILLHRVKTAHVLERECETLPDFDLDRYINAGEFGFRIGPTIHLEANFEAEAAAHLAETPISEDQKLTALADGRVLVEASVPHTEELNWWLRGFGDLVEVISPALVQDSRLSLGSNTDAG